MLRSETPLLALPVRHMVPGNRAPALGSAHESFVGTRALARQLLALRVVDVMTAPNGELGGHSREAVWPTRGSLLFVVSLPHAPVVVVELRAVSRPGLQSGASITVRTWLAPILTVMVVLLSALSRLHVIRRTPGPTDALTDVFRPVSLASTVPVCR